MSNSFETILGRIDERTQHIQIAVTRQEKHLCRINGSLHLHDLRLGVIERRQDLTEADVQINKKRILQIGAAIIVLAGAVGAGVNELAQVIRAVVG